MSDVPAVRTFGMSVVSAVRKYGLAVSSGAALLFAMVFYWDFYPNWLLWLYGVSFYYLNACLLMNRREAKDEKLADWIYNHRWGKALWWWVLPAIAFQIPMVGLIFDYYHTYFLSKGGTLQFPTAAFTIPLWPIFLLLWFIRDQNKDKEIRQAQVDQKQADLHHKANQRQADFHQLQEWVGTETTEVNNLALRVGAIHQLKRYLTGEVFHGVPMENEFQIPTLALIKAVIVSCKNDEIELNERKEGETETEKNIGQTDEDKKGDETGPVNRKEVKPRNKPMYRPGTDLIIQAIGDVLRGTFRKDYPTQNLKPLLSTFLGKMNLGGVDMEGAFLGGARLRQVDLEEANLQGANLQGAVLIEAKLHGANLQGANLVGANLRGADLRGANLREADLSGAGLSWAWLHGADLGFSRLRGADLGRANLYRANLSEANLGGVDLGGAGLSWANLYRADLGRADLRGADLSGADLRGADLRGVGLSWANLDLAKNWKDVIIYDKTNIFGIKNAPEGFREHALSKGAIEEDPDVSPNELFLPRLLRRLPVAP